MPEPRDLSAILEDIAATLHEILDALPIPYTLDDPHEPGMYECALPGCGHVFEKKRGEWRGPGGEAGSWATIASTYGGCMPHLRPL